MELEVYNEYAIVQHYSDLTDYISENIYILDKKNQSEIITENWGLIALGAVILAGLIWLGFYLWNKHKEKKAKEAKTNKEAKEAKKIQEVAEQAAEKSDLSKEEIGDISNLLKFLLITKNQSSLTDNYAGRKESIGNDIEYKWNTGEIKILDKRANQGEFKKAWYSEFNQLKEKLEQYKKVNNLIGNWAKKINTEDVNKEVLKLISNTKDNTDVILTIDKKTSQIVGKMIDRLDFVTLFKQATDAEAENNRIEKMGVHETAELPWPSGSDKILQNAFRSYNNNSKTSKLDWSKCTTTLSLSNETKAFIRVLKAIPSINTNLIPDDISNNVSKKTYEFLADIIDATGSNSNIGGQFTTISQRYSYFILRLLDEVGKLQLTDIDPEKKDNARLAILSIYAHIIVQSILSLYGDKAETKAKIIEKLIIPKELNNKTNDITIELADNTNSFSKNKSEIEKQFKDFAKNADYKKDYQANSNRIIKELLYIDSALDKAKEWVTLYKATYISKFGATGATITTTGAPTSTEIRNYIEED